MTIYTEFECARPPKGNGIISPLKSSGYTVTDEPNPSCNIDCHAKKIYE